MDKVEFLAFLKDFGKTVGVDALNYLDANFDALKLPTAVAPFVKLGLVELKNYLTKTGGLLDLHKFDIK